MKRISLRNMSRTLSEMSPLNPNANSNLNRQAGDVGYRSFLPYLGFLRNSSARSSSVQALNIYRYGSLGHRALLQYIDLNDLFGLKNKILAIYQSMIEWLYGTSAQYAELCSVHECTNSFFKVHRNAYIDIALYFKLACYYNFETNHNNYRINTQSKERYHLMSILQDYI